MGITLTPQHQPDPSPPARAPSTARAPRLLGRRLQGVLFLPVFRSALVVFDFSLFPTELVMSPLGAGAGLAEHEAASSPGEGATAAAPVHPLVRALALAVVVLHGKPRTAVRQAGSALHRASATALGDPLNGNHSTGSRNELSLGRGRQPPLKRHPKPYLVCQ